MKKLSIWANNNPKRARIIIAIAHVLTVINAVCLGMLLFYNDWGTSKWLLTLAVHVFCLSYFIYPKKNGKNNLLKYSYFRQKTLDFTLVISYALVIALGVNNFLTPNDSDVNLPREAKVETTQNADALLVVHRTVPKEKTSLKSLKRAFKKKIKKSRRDIKREFRTLKRTLKKNKDNSTSNKVAKVLLSLLVVFLGISLGYLVAGYACGLSCSGHEGLAWVVLIGGWSILLWLMFKSLNEIWREKDEGEKKELN